MARLPCLFRTRTWAPRKKKFLYSFSRQITQILTYKTGESNYFRMYYRFEKLALFNCMNLRYHITYNFRGAWNTLYAVLTSNYKRDDTTDLLPYQLRNYKLVCLVPWHNVISVTSLRHQYDIKLKFLQQKLQIFQNKYFFSSHLIQCYKRPYSHADFFSRKEFALRWE